MIAWFMELSFGWQLFILVNLILFGSLIVSELIEKSKKITKERRHNSPHRRGASFEFYDWKEHGL